MSGLLIMTLGTGIGDRALSLAGSLARSIVKIQPRLYWLVPSAAQDSVALAELVRDSVANAAQFVPWKTAELYRCIADPDNLEDCRSALREVLRKAKSALREGEDVILNPTSGTKQMSAAATLAALEEEVGRITFTAGPRTGGLVEDGKEQLRDFSPLGFFRDRDTRIARELFRNGAFHGAAELLRKYSDPGTVRLLNRALCMHHWQRLSYGLAASFIRSTDAVLAGRLDFLANAPSYSVAIAGDILASAEACLRWGDAEDALARIYNACERLAKTRLVMRGRAPEEMVELSFAAAWNELDRIGDKTARAMFRPNVRRQLMKRHDTVFGHGHASADPIQTKLLISDLREIGVIDWPEFVAECDRSVRPESL